MEKREYLSVVETAKLLRKALKGTFPEVKFSVRSKSYSGGASIDVSWKDGPTDEEVQKVTNLYRGATFDGMIDLKSYHDSILVDEDGNPRLVHFGADFIFTNRGYSLGVYQAAVNRVCEKWGHEPVPQAVETDFGHVRIEDYNLRIEAAGEYFQTLVHQDLWGFDARSDKCEAIYPTARS